VKRKHSKTNEDEDDDDDHKPKKGKGLPGSEYKAKVSKHARLLNFSL